MNIQLEILFQRNNILKDSGGEAPGPLVNKHYIAPPPRIFMATALLEKINT